MHPLNDYASNDNTMIIIHRLRYIIAAILDDKIFLYDSCRNWLGLTLSKDAILPDDYPFIPNVVGKITIHNGTSFIVAKLRASVASLNSFDSVRR